jgi:hypothetical protein
MVIIKFLVRKKNGHMYVQILVMMIVGTGLCRLGIGVFWSLRQLQHGCQP